jgi:mRNA deadenylase 3'-5' endonuclease subunit Ccr4
MDPPFVSYLIKETRYLRCTDNTDVSNTSQNTSHLDIPVKQEGTPESDINMIDKLIEYTAISPPGAGIGVKTTITCTGDTLDVENKLTSATRTEQHLITTSTDNKYILIFLKILFNDPTIPGDQIKYKGKIKIAPNFFLNSKGEFNLTDGTQYTLLGFTAHYGPWSAKGGRTAGHYVYYKKFANTGNNWVKISDNDISAPMSEADALVMNNDNTIQCKDFLYIKDSEQSTYFTKEKTYNGFQNSTGSLCYMNSMNQLLVSMPEFVDYVQKLSSGPPSAPIRVVTYNILSSFLADKMVMTDKNYENNDNRFKGVTDKLKIEIDKKSIICLQEVSSAWKPRIEKFFRDNDYTINNIENYSPVTKGSPDFQMGVAIAYPTDVYTVVKDYTSEVVGTFKSEPSPRTPSDVWNNVRKKENTILHIMLKHNSSNKEFAVSTYHMPSKAKNQPLMVIHAALAANAAKKYAIGKPYILCGDFNTLPTNEAYTLFTTGKTSLTIPDEGDKWEATIETLQSAYALKGGEPAYTCSSEIKSKPFFQGTIDYIFLSDKWKVTDVLPVPTLGDTESIPNATEPSDHVMIGATLSLD